MTSWNLKNWPIFSLLEPKFISNIRMAIVYGSIGDEALMVTKDGMVYAIGSNASGCLGIGDPHSTLRPEKVEALCEKGIKTFAYGKGPHVLALTENGEMYSWGDNDYSELGDGSTNPSLSPTLIGMKLSKKFIVDIACGGHHCLALTDDGEVYSWGQNNNWQVGHSLSTNQNVPKKVNSNLKGKKIVCISCGDSSSVVVTDNGEVYGWGHNGVGQLGTGKYMNQVHPCKVTSLDDVVIEKVVCGYMHTLAITDRGVLYVWGANSYGQLGFSSDSNICTPTKLEVPEMGRVSDIAASHYNHISVAMGERNRVFMWGHCLGQGIKVPTLTPLKCLHDAFAYYALPSVMYQPLILDSEEGLNLIDSLREAFDDPETSDLIIQVGGLPIYVHKAILKIRCHYFRIMFQEHWAENNQNVVEHDQFSHDVYKAFLKYLYTDEIDLPPENALELFDLANVYSEYRLKRRCIQMIKKETTIQNVAFLYVTAIEYNVKELEEYCFKFALSHMTAVVQTENFARLDETTVKSFIVKAAQAGAFKR